MFQYKDHISRNWDSHYKGKTVKGNLIFVLGILALALHYFILKQPHVVLWQLQLVSHFADTLLLTCQTLWIIWFNAIPLLAMRSLQIATHEILLWSLQQNLDASKMKFICGLFWLKIFSLCCVSFITKLFLTYTFFSTHTYFINYI